jgi:SAM-dependent methyltransferase
VTAPAESPASASAIAAAGLSLARLPANPAKIKLIADLVQQVTAGTGRLRVLDVGAGGKFSPFNLWEPFAPLADRLELVGADVAHLDKTKARAAELGFPVELFECGVERLVDVFGHESFDAVVSTQVLEHVPDWPGGLAQMSDVLRWNGTLYVTCDSGDKALSFGERVRLGAKCSYARTSSRLPLLRRAGKRFLSGDWERAPRLDELHAVMERLGLAIADLRHFGLRGIKAIQHQLDAEGRLRWFELEEQLGVGDPSQFLLLYLRATKPAR